MTEIQTVPTIAQIIAEVRQLAKEFPDCIYTKTSKLSFCSYETGTCTNGQQGCIFGQAFRRLGYPIRGQSAIRDIFVDLDILTTLSQGSWCAQVQIAQDENETWGKAIALADAKYPGVQ